MQHQGVVRAGSKAGYMHEIDGVRGIALTLVMVFHVFGNGRVSGGVDVFLVLSAYFLTRKLLGYFDRPEPGGGRKRPGAWLRKHFIGVSTRLIPSAVIVLAAVLIATWLWLPATRYLQTFREVFASALYYENWELISSQLSYGAAGPDSSPVQHFWSLAVQGQFFLVWPFLALALYALFARGGARRPTFRAVFLGTTLALTAASFVWALVLVDADQTVAYFNTFSRFWELGAGAMIAFIPATFLAHGWVREAGVWVGLAMILVCGLIFDGAREFPGVPALWPVGASLLVLFGATRGAPDGWAAHALSVGPVKFLARIAYQLYLWHWPVLIFTMRVRGETTVSWGTAIFIAAVSFALSIATERIVSAVSRRSLSDWSWPRAAAVPLVPLMLLAVTTVGWAELVDRQRHADLAAAARLSPEQVGAGALAGPGAAAPLDPDPDVGFLPTPTSAFIDLAPIYDEGCIQSHRDEPGDGEVLVCDVDDFGRERTVVLTGGSFSVQWYPALRRIAEQQHWRLLVIEKDGCRLTTEQTGDTCSEWNGDVVRTIASYDPDLVFTLGSVVSFEPGTPEEIPRGMIEQVERLGELGIEVVGIRGTPKFAFDVPECLVEHGADPSSCSLQRYEKLAPDFFGTLAADLPANLRIIDLSDALCGPTTCEPIVGNVLVYRDDGHMTSTYARTTEPALLAALREAVPQLFSAQPSSSQPSSAQPAAR